MVQPALKSFRSSDIQRQPSSAYRLEAETGYGARPDLSVTSMAERFAPDALRALRDERLRLHAELGGLCGDAALDGLAGDAPRFGLTRGVMLVLTGVAIAPAAILAGLLWFGAIRGPEAHFASAVTDTKTAQQAAVAATPLIAVPAPVSAFALSVPETITARAGEFIAFAIAIAPEGVLPARSTIAIRDLPEGVTFSAGQPFGTHEWNLRPDDVSGLTLQAPEDVTDGAKLRLELMAPDGGVLAQADTRLEIVPPPLGLPLRSGEADRIDDLMDHGSKMIAVGYFAGARAYFERAAEAGSGAAALAVGATYDPNFIAALGVQGIKPEPEAAEIWYRRASALGVSEPETQLAALKEQWTQSSASEKERRTHITPDDAAPYPAERHASKEEEKEPGPLGRLVAAASELTSKGEWVEVSSAVNMRKGASGSADTVRIMPGGTKLRVKGHEGNWVEVADPTTKEQGWIYRRYLEETAAP